jgi:hypothetical protein
MSERRKLSDILLNSERDRLTESWRSTKAADDLKPIPSGEYRCRITDGNLHTAKRGTPGYKITLEVIDGDHAGRKLWYDFWLTEDALPLAKRDLAKLGVTDLEQLERPLPQGIVLNAKVVLRRNDDGSETNRITRFEVVGVEPIEPDPFAPPNNGPSTPSPDAKAENSKPDDRRDPQGFNWTNGEQQDPPAKRGRGAYSKK